MAKPKPKPGAKKTKPAVDKDSSSRLGLIKSASKKAATAAAKMVKTVKAKVQTPEPERPAKGKKVKSGPTPAEKPPPKASKLPSKGSPLNTREMEQVLTAGAGRGVTGEGSLKGKLILKEGLPNLQVVGRDKRELTFVLQGPDQNALSDYVDHKVSVTGLIKKTTNYIGTVDVRKYTAKKLEAVVAPTPVEQKLRFLSPGELEQVCNAGMGAGVRGYSTLRGNLEMTGEEFFLVVSGGGTRHQVSFVLDGKVAKSLKKHLGQVVAVNGVVDKSSGWGGRITVEGFEIRASEPKSIVRELLEVTSVEELGPEKKTVDVKLNNGLSVRLPERAGHTWAIEPTTAKRVGLREANYEAHGGHATREFFFTPRNPGVFDIEFFLAKALTPAQVAETLVLSINVMQ